MAEKLNKGLYKGYDEKIVGMIGVPERRWIRAHYAALGANLHKDMLKRSRSCEPNG